jgi:hypothetical protein
MQKSTPRALGYAGLCVLAAVVGLFFSDPLGASEFSGGTVTGPLVTLHEVSGCLFVASGVMAFVYQRVAAGVALVAWLLSLPLYLYFVAPRPFRIVIPGEYQVLAQAAFAWNTLAVVGIVVGAAAAGPSLMSLWRSVTSTT